MAEQKQHSGIYKYPGTAATVITLIIGGVFLGALWANSGGGHHGEGHGGDHAAAGGDHAAEAGGDHAAEGGEAKAEGEGGGH